jgi:hypothetical protein
MSTLLLTIYTYKKKNMSTDREKGRGNTRARVTTNKRITDNAIDNPRHEINPGGCT